jgi:probable F420-dependent oxidoreductase
MESKIRIAVSLYPQHAGYSDIRRAAQQAEALGVDVVYTWDHFYPLSGDPDGRHFECWTLLAALAEATQGIQIGALVACNSYRNPELVADMARTLDHISDGRAILGIGSGWHKRDYQEYGYEFGTRVSRLNDLEDALPRIQKRLASLNPPPMGRLPVLIGGGGEKLTLRIVAEYADIWHGFAEQTDERSHVETVAHKNRVLDNWCEKRGRDPCSIERSIGVDAKLVGLADDIQAAGADEVCLGLDGPEYDFAPIMDWLAWRDGRNNL